MIESKITSRVSILKQNKYFLTVSSWLSHGYTCFFRYTWCLGLFGPWPHLAHGCLTVVFPAGILPPTVQHVRLATAQMIKMQKTSKKNRGMNGPLRHTAGSLATLSKPTSWQKIISTHVVRATQPFGERSNSTQFWKPRDRFFSLSFVTKGYLRCTCAVRVPKRISYVQNRVVKIVSI